MKIGIDTFGCNHGQSGLGAYLDSISRNFKNSESIEYEFFGNEIDRYTYAPDSNLTFTAVTIPEGKAADLVWHIFRCNSFAKKQKYDVVLYPAAVNFLPWNFKVPGVIIVNDIISEMMVNLKFMDRCRLRHALKKADRIIVASQFLKKDLKKIGIKQDKIDIVHSGIDHSLFYPQPGFDDFSDIRPVSIQKPYFIYASRMSSPLKKHCQLVKAFSMFKEKTGLPHRLVLAGCEGDYADQVQQEVFESPYASDIFMTGFFSSEYMPSLYSESEGCIFPSVNEGVGMPVLEAMATGIPIACSKGGSLAEMAGNNAVYFDSDNIKEMALAIEKIAVDENYRKKAVDGEIAWSNRFSWQKTAEEVVEVLKQVVEKHGKKRRKQ